MVVGVVIGIVIVIGVVGVACVNGVGLVMMGAPEACATVMVSVAVPVAVWCG